MLSDIRGIAAFEALRDALSAQLPFHMSGGRFHSPAAHNLRLSHHALVHLLEAIAADGLLGLHVYEAGFVRMDQFRIGVVEEGEEELCLLVDLHAVAVESVGIREVVPGGWIFADRWGDGMNLAVNESVDFDDDAWFNIAWN